MRRKGVAAGCIALVVIIIAMGAYVVFTLSSAMSKENITQTVEIEGCRLISGVIGPEDFEYLPEANGLVVSSLDRRAPEETTGGLYWIDLAKPPEEQVAEPILTDYPGHFKPHGLTFQPTEEGGRLFVISHPEAGEWPHTIEVFSLTFSNGAHEWQHIQTLTDEMLISPNDLVALPDDGLFISNDFQDLGGGMIGLVVDTLLRRKRAPLVYYDGNAFTDLDANVISSAGITAVKEGDHEYLYRDMMEKGAQKLEIHWDQPGKPRVELVDTIHLNSGADNFTVDEEGAVYVAAHHSYGLLLDHANDETVLSPTQVFRISPDGEATLLYANQGEEISAGSVGAVVEDRLYIGQIYGDGVLSCPMDSE